MVLAMVLGFRDGTSAEDRDAVLDEAQGRLRARLPSLSYVYLMPARGGP